VLSHNNSTFYPLFHLDKCAQCRRAVDCATDRCVDPAEYGLDRRWCTGSDGQQGRLQQKYFDLNERFKIKYALKAAF
jgi:hypothetical protein